MTQPDLEQNIVYKVVYPKGDSLLSACVKDRAWIVLYTPGRATKPNHRYSPLFAFSDLLAAFAWANNSQRIWKARAEGIRDSLQDIPLSNNPEAFDGFWRNRWLHLPQILAHHGFIPQGTVFCGSITLLERVA